MRVPCQGLHSHPDRLIFELDIGHMKVFCLHYAALPAQLELASCPQHGMSEAIICQANLPVDI